MTKFLLVALLLLLLSTVTSTCVHSPIATSIDDLKKASATYQTSEVAQNTTLAGAMQSIASVLDWQTAIYAGMLFDQKTKTDLEAMIDKYAQNSDWLNVLRWTVICRKLGIEREAAIKQALNNLSMIGPLPWTTLYGGTNYFCVEQKFALFGYRYAEKYDYRLDKWNKTSGYEYFRNTTYSIGHPVLFMNALTGWGIGYGPRYYDEAACTVQCFLIFYELGISEALSDALYWWSWINDNLWYENTHYKYGLNSPNYECEAGFFAKVIANLKHYVPDLGNWSRITSDLQNRFLTSRWDSRQWFSGTGGTSTYVVVHHYPSNDQRRLQNTIGAWTAMFSLYDEFEYAAQLKAADMLRGFAGLNPAWELLLSNTASLYDAGSRRFRWESTNVYSADATAYGLALMFFLGMIPHTALLAFPLEEYSYEYIFDIDPDLYSIDLTSHTVRISVVRGGQLEFIYGSIPTFCDLPTEGTYEITFTDDWNAIAAVHRLHALPTNRQYVGRVVRTWTVDDDLPADFDSIQDAIDAAGTGDIIYVKNGTYHEHIALDKMIFLKGENKESTVIDGSGVDTVVSIFSSGANLAEFSIKNSGVNAGDAGIVLHGASDLIIQDNNISCNYHGIWLNASRTNTISNNILMSNAFGITLLSSSDNYIMHNSFLNNTIQVYNEVSVNTWTADYPSGGNYWSDYTGTDRCKGPNQNMTGKDGIGDAPYFIDERNWDDFPLMPPDSLHDIGMIFVSLSKSIISQNCIQHINIAVVNYGSNDEDIYLILSSDNISLANVYTRLNSRCASTIIFEWNTSGIAIGDYALAVRIPPVLGEEDFADNYIECGTIHIVLTGDINGDGRVDVKDVYATAKAFGSFPEHQKWNPVCDVNDDGLIDVSDYYVVCSNYGREIVN